MSTIFEKILSWLSGGEEMAKDRSYFYFLDKKKREGVSEKIPNSSIYHASDAIVQLLMGFPKKSHIHVRVASGSLDPRAFNSDVIEQAKKVLGDGGRIDVIVELDDEGLEYSEGSFARFLDETDGATLRTVAEEIDHFMFVGKRYRKEIDRKRYSAVVCFNDDKGECDEFAKKFARYEKMARQFKACSDTSRQLVAG